MLSTRPLGAGSCRQPTRHDSLRCFTLVGPRCAQCHCQPGTPLTAAIIHVVLIDFLLTEGFGEDAHVVREAGPVNAGKATPAPLAETHHGCDKRAAQGHTGDCGPTTS